MGMTTADLDGEGWLIGNGAWEVLAIKDTELGLEEVREKVLGGLPCRGSSIVPHKQRQSPTARPCTSASCMIATLNI